MPDWLDTALMTTPTIHGFGIEYHYYIFKEGLFHWLPDHHSRQYLRLRWPRTEEPRLLEYFTDTLSTGWILYTEGNQYVDVWFLEGFKADMYFMWCAEREQQY